MDEQLRTFLNTWDLSRWRRYLHDTYKGAEIGNPPLTDEQRKTLRRHVFAQFKRGVPGSADVTGMVWAMLERHKERWDHPDTKPMICPNCDCVSGLRDMPPHERIKCAVCGKYSTRWQWQEDHSAPKDYEHETNDPA